MAKRDRNQEVQEQEVVETQEVVENQEGSEFETNGEQVDTSAPTAEEAANEAKDTRVWTLEDGKTVTKSEFIRHQFTVNNLSRKQIAENFDINYRTVYGATVNMANESEPTTRGRNASATKILVSAAGQVITVIKDGESEVYHLDNVAVEDAIALAAINGAEEVDHGDGTATPAFGPAVEVDRNTWVKEQVAAGRDRGEVAKALGLSYGVIYGMTKDAEGTKQRHEFEVAGETITRSEYIRRLHASGVSKSDIAKQLGVDYPVVWSALKGLKSEDDKFADAVEKLAKFADKVVDAEAFNAIIEQLKATALKQEEVAAPAEEAATEAAASTEESVYTEDQAAE